MSTQEQYFHWLIGDNILRDDEPTYLVNLEFGVSIRFDYGEAYFSEYEDFINDIADIQFLTGSRPHKEQLDRLLTDAWNFLVLTEREEENRAEREEDLF